MRAVIALSYAALLSACSLALDFDSRTGAGDGGSAVDDADAGAHDAAVDSVQADTGKPPDPTAPCPVLKGPRGVRVGNFCIDETPVTNGQYELFLAADSFTVVQTKVCDIANSTFIPEGWPRPTPANIDQPVVGVGWCDAVAYCQWANKRLCGAVGTPLAWEQRNTSANQWYQACSKPVAGLAIMAAGICEWADVCESAAVDAKCAAHGCDDQRAPVAAGCEATANVIDRNRNTGLGSVGFRCCSD